jgi:hypothetical protein
MANIIEPMYQAYCGYIRSIVESKDVSSFKGNSAYQGILEHVSSELGHKYLETIVRLHGITRDNIVSFCKRNDAIGSPKLVSIDGMLVSPSSLRYICHALLILSHCVRVKNLTPSIVEVGCGYGGLALAIDSFSSMFGVTVKSYTMIDLDDPLRLQTLYLSNHTCSFPVYFESASTYGSNIKGNDNFLVSNYCFSEVHPQIQQNYLRTLFPKCRNGFLLWNHVKIFDIGKKVLIEQEVPLTCPTNATNSNYHVYF